MELASGPTRESAAKPTAPRSSGPSDPTRSPPGRSHPSEVLEGDGRVVELGGLDQPPGERVETRTDPVPLPPPLAAEQSPTDPSVRSLLPGQMTTPVDVTSLDRSDLGERHRREMVLPGTDGDPVERGLVRIERQQGGRAERFRGGELQQQDRPIGGNVQLFDPNADGAEGLPMVLRDLDLKRAPEPVAERQANFPALGIEMEGGAVGADEGTANVRGARSRGEPEASTVAPDEGESDLRCDDGMAPGELQGERSVSSESRHRASGGLPGGERLPNDLVDQASVVLKGGEEGGRKGTDKGEGESANNGGHAGEETRADG
jgi:hypothetical protein